VEPDALRRWVSSLGKRDRRELRAAILSLVRLTYLQAGNRSKQESNSTQDEKRTSDI
jgi:hypothetical protein